MPIESPHRTLWVDCEFTGLSVREDVLLEIGAVVTDGLFQEIDSYQAVIAQNVDTVKSRMAQDEWWPNRPAHSGQMLDEVANSRTTLAMVDEALTSLVKQHFMDPVILAGNSIGLDRQYISRDLPTFNDHLHYRSIDVSSFKEVARRLGVHEYKKSEQHRVLADIRESMDELNYLLRSIGAPAVQQLVK